MTKLGSLFDGSGGFPLAGAMHGIEPAWASEIEPYPIRVTTARFPAMKHLGDITKINGAEIEPVDIITFGSPCTDMSVAGKRAGLDGSQSVLFYEAIRIIKEMRRATNGVYPRVAVWENVPGAFSSHNGKDFQSVLQAFCGIVNEDVDVPKPAKWQSAGCIMGNGFSVAWRTLDAQYCGVPQRRRRIYLVADFAGQSAGEIFIEPQSVRGDTAEGRAPGEGAAGDAERSVGRSVWPTIAGSLRARGDSSPCVDNGQPFVCCAFDNHPRDIDIGVAGTIRSNCHGDVTQVCYAVDAVASNSMKSANPNSGFHEETVAKYLDTSGGNPSCNQGGNVIVFKERAGCPGGGKGILCGEDVQDLRGEGQGSRILQQALHQIQEIWKPIAPQRKYIIRRLSPLECARLQGFPDWWESNLEIRHPTDNQIEFWVNVLMEYRRINGCKGRPYKKKQVELWLKKPIADSARYKMWGNGIALPCAAFVLGRIAKELGVRT